MAMRIKIEDYGTPRKKYKRRGCSATGNYEHLKPHQFQPGNQMASSHHTPRLKQRFDKEVQAALLEQAPPELRKMAKIEGKRVVTTIYALTRVLIRLAGTGELDALLAIAKLNDSGTEALRAGTSTKVDARKQQVVQWIVKYPKPEKDDDGRSEVANRTAIEGHALSANESAEVAGPTQDR
jgi:hypothetical protein